MDPPSRFTFTGLPRDRFSCGVSKLFRSLIRSLLLIIFQEDVFLARAGHRFGQPDDERRWPRSIDGPAATASHHKKPHTPPSSDNLLARDYETIKLNRISSSLLFCLVMGAATALYGQGMDNPTGPAGMFNGNVTTGCSYDPYTGNAMRSVTDIAISGAVGSYPLALTRTFNSRLGGAWVNNYTWSIAPGSRHTGDRSYPAEYAIEFPDGRRITFQYQAPNLISPGPPGTGERMLRLDLNTMLCYLLLSDGGKIEFKATQIDDGVDPDPDLNPKGYRYYHYTYQVQAIIDPYGLRTAYSYGNQTTRITEPAGRWLQLNYTYIGAMEVLDHVSASDGRTVQYHYAQGALPPGVQTYTYLTGVTYYGDPAIGTAAYTYQGSNVDYNGPPLLKTCYDPMYAGPMVKLSYEYVTGGYNVGGQILREKNGDGTVVSTAGQAGVAGRTETRGDGPSRSFTYTSDGAFLTNWTDFKGKPMSQTRDTKGYVNSFTDANGFTTNMIREVVTGRITTLTHPPDANGIRYSINYGYKDPANPYFLDHVTDELGHTTTYTRDGLNRITRISYPDTSYETFTYNGFNEVLTHRMKNGGTESFTYDARGTKTASRDPYHASGNPNFWYLYDGLDRLWKVTDSRGTGPGDPNYTTIYNYNTRGQLTKVTHPPDPGTGLSYTVTSAYDANGNRTSATDELGHTTLYAYDSYRRVIKVTDALGHFGTSSYLPWGKSSSYLTTSSFVYVATAPSGKKVYNYADANLRRTQTTQAPGTADQAVTYYTYDNVGNLLSVKDPKS